MPEFVHKPVQVTAERVERDAEIITDTGPIRGRKGDWMLTMPNGERIFAKDKDFRDFYAPADRLAQDYLDEDG